MQVTGPVNTMPNSTHSVENGAMCDNHPNRVATTSKQGETDSFGSEIHELCDECEASWKAQASKPYVGYCEFCTRQAYSSAQWVQVEVFDYRDYEEGMNGPVYKVCKSHLDSMNESQLKQCHESNHVHDFDDEYWPDSEDENDYWFESNEEVLEAERLEEELDAIIKFASMTEEEYEEYMAIVWDEKTPSEIRREIDSAYQEYDEMRLERNENKNHVGFYTEPHFTSVDFRYGTTITNELYLLV